LPDQTWKNPYLQHGSRPETVEWVWDTLGSVLPVDCRCFLYGTPALVDPELGVVLAVAWGTTYFLQVPPAVAATAAQLSGALVQALTKKGFINVSQEFGREWVYGLFRKEELDWCRAVYKTLDDPSTNKPSDIA
jgi:hypothetical protein